MPCVNHLSSQHRGSVIGGLLAALFCVSCDGGSTSSPPAAVGAVPVVQLEGFEKGRVSLTGSVRLEGTPANPDTEVKVGGDDFCLSHEPIRSERWKITPGNGLQDVIVSVLDAPGTPVNADQVSIRQEGCVYRPHVSAIGLGQSVVIRNDDDTFHNVRVVEHKPGTLNGGRNIENYGQPNKGSRHVHRFDQPGIYRLECDVHRWMRSWVFVHANNHVAVTQDDGTFTIPYGLRDGSYTVAAWHPQFAKPIQRQVQVAEGKAVVDFTFRAEDALN